MNKFLFNLRIAVAIFIFFNLSSAVSAQVDVTATAGTTGPTTYATINAAFTAINAGTHQGAITVSVTANVTEPATAVPLLRSTSPSSYTSILIRPSGASGNYTITSAAAPTASRGMIELNGADNVTIDGDPTATGTRRLTFIVAATTSITAAIRFSSTSTTGTDGADNCTIKNCNIIGGRSLSAYTTITYGIALSNSSAISTGAYSSINTTIENNTITRCLYGIWANGASATYPLNGTKILKNTMTAANGADKIGKYGITVNNTCTSVGVNSPIIEQNILTVGDTTATISGMATSVYGIWLNANNAGVLVNRNYVYDIFMPSTAGWSAAGIYISSNTGHDGIDIRNNIIRDAVASLYLTTVTSSFLGHGIYCATAVTNIKIRNNTIVQSISPTTGTGTASGTSIIINSSTATIADFSNNIVVNKMNKTSAYGFYLGTTTVTTMNNNNYFVPTGNLGYYNAANRANLSAWQTATSKDGSSLNIDPTSQFTSSTNLHIPDGTSTQLESGGMNNGITTDIDGQTRPGPTSTYGGGTSRDIGADEFDGTPPACVDPSALTKSSITVNSATIGWTAPSPTPSMGYNYDFSTTRGTPSGTGTHVPTGTSATLTGLSANTKYYFYVQSDCGGPGTSNWVEDSLTTLCTPLAAGTYTIGSSGTYTTIAAAIYDLNCGGVSGPVVFNIAAGTYNEKPVLNSIPGASSTNTVTFQSASGTASSVTISNNSDATSGAQYTWLFSGASFVTVKNLTIQATGTTNAKVITINGVTSNLTFDNVIFDGNNTTSTSTNYNGITAITNTTSNITVKNSTFIDVSYGIQMVGTSTVKHTGLLLDNNNITAYYMGIRVDYNLAPIITNNTVTTNVYSSSYGIYSYYNDSSVVISNNKITGSYYGMYVYYNQGGSGFANKVHNNMVAMTGTGAVRGINVYCSSTVTYGYMEVYHNSVSVTSTSTTGYAFYKFGLVTNMYIKNNIFSNTGGGRAAFISYGGLGGADMDYNDLYATGSVLADSSSTTYTYATLSAWQTAFGKDMNSVSVNPTFTNATSDLHASAAGVNNVGTPGLGVTTDIDGQTRSTTNPDIGADEFTPPTCFFPTALNVTAKTNSTANIAWTAPATAPSVGYEYDYSTTRGTPSSASGTTTGTTAALSPLSGGTKYYYYVRSDCNFGDFSIWAEDSFTTLCDPTALTVSTPFNEGFNATTIPTCWTSKVEVTGTTAPLLTYVTSGTSTTKTPSSGSHFVHFNSFNASAGTRIRLNTPLLNTSALTAGVEVSFDWWRDNSSTYSANNERIIVSYSLDAGTTWVDVDSVSRYHVTLNGWQRQTYNLPSGAINSSVIVGLTFVSQVGYNSALDSFTVQQSPSCLPVGALTKSAITDVSGTLTWVASATAPSSGYDVFTSTTRGTPSSSTNVPSGLTYTFSSLSPATMQYIYVRANCGTGDYSTWKEDSFMTQCSPVSSFTEGFETTAAGTSTVNTYPACFNYLDKAAGYNYVSTTSTYVNSGTKGYYSYNSNAADTLALVSPILSNLSAGTHQLTLFARGSSTGYTVQIGTMSDPGNISTYVAMADIALTSTYTKYTFDPSLYSIPGGHKHLVIRNAGAARAIYLDDISWAAKPSLDMAITGISSPGTGCLTNAESVTVSIRNGGTATIDFSVNPTTVSVLTTNKPAAAAAYNDSLVLSTGTLASGSSTNVTMPSTYNMLTVDGTYTFSYKVKATGDAETSNDSVGNYQVISQKAIAAAYCESFTTTSTPTGWLATSMSAASSHNNAVTGGGANGYYTNLYSSLTSSNFRLPKLTVASGDSFSFDYRLMQYSSYPTGGAYTATSTVKHYIQVSTNCGLSYTTIDSIHIGNHTNSTAWARKAFNLAPYAGQDIYMRVLNQWDGTSGDYFIDFDNVCVASAVCADISTLPVFYDGTATRTVNANKECIDYTGWTHYIKSGSADTILLSVNKQNQNIGRVGTGAFNMYAGTGPGHVDLSTVSYLTNATNWWVMNRWWGVTAVNEPTTQLNVRTYYTTADFNAIVTAASKTGSYTHDSLIHYKITKASADPNPNNGHAGVTANDIIGIKKAVSMTDSTFNYAAFGSAHQVEFKVSGFSGGGGGGTPLNVSPVPVELIYFTANASSATNAKLNWATAQELNNDRFEIYRSYDGVTFDYVNSVAGKGTSNSVVEYTYIDVNAAANGNVVYYKLKQVDYNGAFEYTETKKVIFSSDLSKVSAVSIVPNPFSNYVVVSLSDLPSDLAQIRVTDATGKIAHTQTVITTNGQSSNVIVTDNLPMGVYFITVESDGVSKTQRMIKTN